MLWDFQAKARLVNSNQKNGILVSSSGVLFKGHIAEGIGNQGRLLVQGLFSEVISETCDWWDGI